MRKNYFFGLKSMRFITAISLCVVFILVVPTEAKAWRLFGRETKHSECQGDLGYKWEIKRWYFLGIQVHETNEPVPCD